MPSVTEVLDYSIPPQLANWFKNNSKAKCEQIGTETARIGQLVDSLIQQDIKEGGYVPPEEDAQALNCLGGWEQLKIDHPEFVPSVKKMQIELKVGDLIGHPDYVCEEKDGWGITDLKCTSGIRLKNYIQCSEYSGMLMAVEGRNFPSFVRIIRLQRDSDAYEWSEVRDQKFIRYCMETFQAYRSVYESEKIMKEFFRNQLEDQLLGDF